MTKDEDTTNESDGPTSHAEDALDIVAAQYADLLWKLYWHKKRNGELTDLED